MISPKARAIALSIAIPALVAAARSAEQSFSQGSVGYVVAATVLTLLLAYTPQLGAKKPDAS
jgi:hypothetical protein